MTYRRGKAWPYCPRTILRNAVARAADLGFSLKMGVEAEFFLVRKDENGRLVVDDPLDTSEQPCYDARALYRNYEFLTTLSRYANELGYGNYANDHEDANGQFESNFDYDDALITCDRAIFFRYMVHVMAQQRGKLATFMPKPFGHLTGNGCHFHVSLWDKAGKKNLFWDGKNDAHGYGLSDHAYHFIAGLIHHADAVSAIVAPTVNSYKRIGVGAPDSGATWSPAYAAWGGNNRTQMIRVPGGPRIEHRGIDGSANPYLAATAVLAAGLDGIERKLDPGPQNTANLYTATAQEISRKRIKSLPTTLADATVRCARMPCCATGSATPARRTTATTSPTPSCASSRVALAGLGVGSRPLPDAVLFRSWSTSRTPMTCRRASRGRGQRHRCALAGSRPRGRLGRRRAQPAAPRARPAADARTRPRRRGGDLLRALGQRPLVAGGRDAPRARGDCLVYRPDAARTRSSPATSPWTCWRSASAGRRSSHICRVRASSGPGPPGSTTPSRPDTRLSARPMPGRCRCRSRARPGRPGSCIATTCRDVAETPGGGPSRAGSERRPGR